MAGRNGQGESFSPGSRKRDRSIDDALKTMERLAAWLETANQENAWQQAEDPIQAAMLHGMLVYLRVQIDQLIALGGDEVHEMVRALKTLASQEV
jgi:(p)ppGpp synthase/HD superfamily hydrolase